MGGQGRPLRARGGMLLSGIALAAVLALSGCGSSGSTNSGSASQSSSTAQSTGAGTTAASAGGSSSSGSGFSWCGSKPITLGIQDGGGLNAWSQASLQQVKLEAAKCPAIKKEIVVNAGFDPQKGTSGLQSMIAQGVNAIVIIPDSGVCAELPTLRQATARGIKVATWAASACGKVPQDYQSYTDWDTAYSGEVATAWLAKQMHGKGNLLFLGGPAGNLVDQGHVKGMYAELKKYPGIHVLDNVSTSSWPVTNWDPAQAQKTTAALLAKYPTIDGVMDLYGSDAQGDIAAFKQAGRKVPPIVSTQLNSLSCLWQKDKGTANAFGLADFSNRNWLGRLAVRQAVSAVNGVKDPEKQTVPLPLLEDSSNPAMLPKCYSGQGPNYDPSNAWSDSKVSALVNG
jgi:ribose transport system substrate-binding protein